MHSEINHNDRHVLLHATTNHLLGDHKELFRMFYDVIARQCLSVIFQPIIDLESTKVFGYEGMIRGPSNSLLHSPTKLFSLAQQCGMDYEFENLCCKIVVEQFTELQLGGVLLLKRSYSLPNCCKSNSEDTHKIVQQAKLEPERVVVVLDAKSTGGDSDPDLIWQNYFCYRSLGFQVALDNQGIFLSSLESRLEISPAFVKFERYFIENIDQDPVKAQFVNNLLESANKIGRASCRERV